MDVERCSVCGEKCDHRTLCECPLWCLCPALEKPPKAGVGQLHFADGQMELGE